MSTFAFKAIDVSGRHSTGTVDADSKQAVADQLKARGLIILDISDKTGSKEIKLPWADKVKTTDLTVMTRQLATMVSSGMTILRALYVLESQTESKPLKETLTRVRKDVEAGLPFSDSLEKSPKVFNPLYVAMVRAGETGGVLESALMRTADQLEADANKNFRRLGIPTFYPTYLAPNSSFDTGSRTYEYENEDNKKEEAYKTVIAIGATAPITEYYGFMGTTWDDPPILRNPSETRNADGEECDVEEKGCFMLFYDGDRLRLVAWKADGNSYWLNNTLTLTLEEPDMMAIATTMNEVTK